LPTVTIGTVATDDAINYSEGHTQGGVPVSGTVTGLAGTAVTLTLTQGGTSKSYQTSITNGTWSAALSSTDLQALANGSATLTAQAQDQYGNQSAPVTHAITIADTLPTVTIDAVEGNDIITAAEAAADVPLSGTVTGLSTGAHFQVTVSDGSFTNSYMATVAAGGTWSAIIPAADASALAPGSATISAQVSDTYGNTGSASDTITVQGATQKAPLTPTFDLAATDQTAPGSHQTTAQSVTLVGTTD